MPAPYNPQTIAAIRAQARRSVSARVIASLLGWDVPQLERVTKRHDIRLVAISGTPISEAEPAPKYCKPIGDGKLKPLNTFERDCLTWDVETRMVLFRGSPVKLTKWQIKTLGILARATQPLDPAALSERTGYGEHHVRSKVHVARLRAKLAEIGLSISSGHGLGYQLIVKT
jgi:DNA-binding response OmpR family regulator